MTRQKSTDIDVEWVASSSTDVCENVARRPQMLNQMFKLLELRRRYVLAGNMTTILKRSCTPYALS